MSRWFCSLESLISRTLLSDFPCVSGHCSHVHVPGQVTVLPGEAGDENMGTAGSPKASDSGLFISARIHWQPFSIVFLSCHQGGWEMSPSHVFYKHGRMESVTC